MSVSPKGEILGEHDGIYYYTIGQRIGPRFEIEIKKEGKSNMKKWYIAKKDVKNNIITIAPQKHKILYKKELIVKDFHLISNNNTSKKFRQKLTA